MIRKNLILLLIMAAASAISFYALFAKWDFKNSIVLTGGIVFLLSVIMMYKKTYAHGMNYLSSPFSFLYYSIIPVSLLSLFVVFMVLIYTGMIPFVFVQEGIIFVPLMIVFGIFSWSLKTVYYDKSKIYFHGWGVVSTVQLTEVTNIKRYLFYFYKLYLRDDQSPVIFIPPIFEVFAAFGGRPKSIQEFIGKINPDES